MDLFLKNNSIKNRGMTIVEILIGTAVLLVIAISIYQGFVSLLNLVNASRLKISATALANEQVEIVRNLPYNDVGILGGVPPGKIHHSQLITRDGVEFTVVTTVRNVDDPFDGTLGGAPNDTSPADYKLVEMEVTCPVCNYYFPIKFTTTSAPKNLETASTNGALFVQVFNSHGVAVQDADVHIENNKATASIIIDDVTDVDGMLRLIDVPPGTEAYEITVTKPGYSTDKTYTPGAPSNPNPAKSHFNVSVQQVTPASFQIDQLGTMYVSSIAQNCVPLGGIPYDLFGSKLIGSSPNVLKYSQVHTTSPVNGTETVSGLEWDDTGYNISLLDSDYDLAGTIPLLPATLAANSAQDIKMIIKSASPKSLLVTVRDPATFLPLSSASVTIEKGGVPQTLITGRGFLNQTDWSGGEGQHNFSDGPSKYFVSDGNLDVSDPAGTIKLRKPFSEYVSAGNLTSSTFDTGSASNFHQIVWQPQAQAPETGTDSVRFQIATNNDNTTWNFLGPDGTSGSYYTISNSNINALHNGDRYFRYKVFLSTEDTAFTPTISDVSFTFTSSCVPPGQALFQGLSSGTYNITISRTGYQTYNDIVSVSSGWQQRDISLLPE